MDAPEKRAADVASRRGDYPQSADLYAKLAQRADLLRGDVMSIDLLSPREQAQALWLDARDLMIEYSSRLAEVGLHKQICNRLTEPWMPITVLVSATSFANWFHLRDHKDAQPEIQVIATEMHYQYNESAPTPLAVGEWHLPYIREGELEEIRIFARDAATYSISPMDAAKAVSVGRCARVSYLSHEGVRDFANDVALHDKLKATADGEDPGHFSVFEHVAQALDHRHAFGNFTGWRQYRKEFVNEAGPPDFGSHNMAEVPPRATERASWSWDRNTHTQTTAYLLGYMRVVPDEAARAHFPDPKDAKTILLSESKLIYSSDREPSIDRHDGFFYEVMSVRIRGSSFEEALRVLRDRVRSERSELIPLISEPADLRGVTL